MFVEKYLGNKLSYATCKRKKKKQKRKIRIIRVWKKYLTSNKSMQNRFTSNIYCLNVTKAYHVSKRRWKIHYYKQSFHQNQQNNITATGNHSKQSGITRAKKKREKYRKIFTDNFSLVSYRSRPLISGLVRSRATRTA